jgi:hypothetical protein
MIGELKSEDRPPVLCQFLICWFLLSVITALHEFGGRNVADLLFIPEFINATTTLAVCLDLMRECGQTITALDRLRATPRPGTIWTRKGKIL